MLIDEMLTHVPELARYARSLVRNREDADDLVQETLARALDKLNLYDPRGSFKGWLNTIMKNLFFDDWRKRVKRPSREYIPEVHDAGRTCKPNQDDRLLGTLLCETLDSLRREQREMILLIGIEGTSYEQASDRYGCPIGTIRSRLFRGRAALAEKMDGVAPSYRWRRRPRSKPLRRRLAPLTSLERALADKFADYPPEGWAYLFEQGMTSFNHQAAWSSAEALLARRKTLQMA